MENNHPIIYLDYNATTPIDKRVLETMMPYLTDVYANAHSTHQAGALAKKATQDARAKVAALIGANNNEIVFTSGSTEAINHAIKGVTECYAYKGKHIITTNTEHNAVLDTCKYLESKGAEVTYLPVSNDGLLEVDMVKAALREDTILVCVMYANNETGVLQPINKIAELAHSAGALFMSDCTQAVGKIPVNVDDLGIDLMCLSGHKMYAPKGIGALYIKQNDSRLKLPALFHGGGHENQLRSGTLNVPGIVALGSACEIAKSEMKQDAKYVNRLRNHLEKGLLEISGSFLNGNTTHRIFNVSNICFPGSDANVIIGRMKNVAVSNGAACSSATIEPSHVLTAMGLSGSDAFSTIRFSLGKFNIESDIHTVIKLMKEILQ